MMFFFDLLAPSLTVRKYEPTYSTLSSLESSAQEAMDDLNVSSACFLSSSNIAGVICEIDVAYSSRPSTVYSFVSFVSL